MPRYEPSEVKQLARGRWAEILSSVAGISPGDLDGDHHPCPKCGGTDRFRFTDLHGDGSIICNHCARRDCGDGLAAIQWAAGIDFPAALTRVAEYVGAKPSINGQSSPSARGRKPSSGQQRAPGPAGAAADPGKDLIALPWSDALAGLFCSRKQPIRPAAILAAGGRLARYRRQYTVVDLPVRDAAGGTVGHAVYNATGGTLPKFDRSGKVTTQLKIKNTWGTGPGLIGRLPGLESRILVKVEGPSDALSLLSCQDLPSDVAVIANAMGAGEKPAAWMLELATGRTCYVIGDADTPGDEGAAMWAGAFARHAAEVRQVRLPYPTTETHGKDLRDWLAEGHGWADLQELAAGAAVVEATSEESTSAAATPEQIDDPHRLARLNLERYASDNWGRTLRYWRDEWYVWKRHRYRKISENEFRAKLSMSIKQEFDRAFHAGETDEVRKVTGGLVSNVMQATSGYVNLSAEVEFGTWLEDRTRRAYVSMENGILDIDAVLACKEEADCLLPHSPQWFSLVSVPYAFNSDAGAEPSKWLAYLDRVLESDQERIAILQEWAGYLLLPDTGQQKFLVAEGDGANGKSVYGAAMTAMLGHENVSNIQLEVFGDRFSRTDTLGKLANICGDVGEIDKVSEGYVKSFTSGDRMYFDRKGVSGLNVVPTARLMINCNSRPRFSDRSDGVWRRMIPMPFRVQIPEDERILGMDKSAWWEESGELPAIFNWALLGLARLRKQIRFTKSRIVESAREEYREEMNPARMFLKQFIEPASCSAVSSRLLYLSYSTWTKENGYRPLSERHFGKEIARLFSVQISRPGTGTDRIRIYQGIRFSVEEICGVKIDERTLF